MAKASDTYASAQDARVALGAAGYQLVHTPPGTPSLWRKGKSDVAVQRRGARWASVPYPTTTLRAAQRALDARLAALAKEAARAPPTKAKRKRAAVDATEDAVVRQNPDYRKPREPDLSIYSKCVGDMKIAVLAKKADVDVKKVLRMVRRKFLIVVP